MKKFLCYDTNDAASGKIDVDSRGMLKPNSTVPSGSAPYQQLVTDVTGTAKWEARLAWKESLEVDFVPEITFEMSDTMVSLECTGATPLVSGDTYKYVLNGVEHEGVAQVIQGLGGYVGIVDTVNNVYIVPNTNILVFVSTTPGAYTVRVYGTKTVYHTIPVAYQESEIYIADIIMPDHDYVLVNCTYEDVLSALQVGKLVFLRDSGNILCQCINGKSVADGSNLYFYSVFNTYVGDEESEIRFRRYTIKQDGTISKSYRSLSGGKSIILESSTNRSTKKFKITVDDTGTISAAEVT